jgi:hypothetical protein
MRPKLAVIVTIATALAGAGVAPAQAAAKKRCAHSAGATTLKKTAVIWAYRAKGSELGAKSYACYRPTGRTLLLHANTGGAATTDVVLDAVAVTGRVVAFHVQASGDSTYDFVRSYDARSGRRLRSSRKFPQPPATGAYPLPRVAIATNARGAIVWLASGVLRALDRSGARVLARETADPISGVAATARTARWTQGAGKHHASLR